MQPTWHWGRRLLGAALLALVFARGIGLMTALNEQLYLVSAPGQPLTELRLWLLRMAACWSLLLALAGLGSWLLLPAHSPPSLTDADDQGEDS